MEGFSNNLGSIRVGGEAACKKVRIWPEYLSRPRDGDVE